MAEEFVKLVKIGLDKSFINDSIANADKLTKSINELKEAKKKEGQLSAEQEGRLKGLTAERNKNIQVVKQANLLTSQTISGQEQLKAKLSILTANYNKLTTSEQKNTAQGQALKKSIRGISDELKANESAIGNNTRNVGNYASALKGVGSQLLGALGITAGIAGLTRVVKDAIGIFTSFEKANSNLKAVLGATSEEMKILSAQAKELGATTSFTASQVVELQTEFAKLGFPTDQITKMTESTLAAAAAMGSDLGEQASLTGAIIKSFGFDAKEAARVNDVLAKATASSALDFAKLSTAIPIVGSTSKAAGVSLERMTALLGKLSDRGLDASSAATAMRNMFLELSKKGLTFEEAMSKINGATDKNIVAMELFGKKGATAGVILSEVSTSAEGTTSELGMLESALIRSGGTAQDMADTQLNNLTGAITILGSAWEGFILSLEDGNGSFSDLLKTTVKVVTELLSIATGTAKMSSELDEAGQRIRDIAEGFISVMSVVKGVVAAYLAYKAAVIVTTIATQAMAAATAIANTGMKAFNVTTKANPIGLLAGVLVGVITSMNSFAEKTREATKEQLAFNQAIEDANNLAKNTRSIEQRANVIDSLNKAQVEKLQSDIESELSSIDAKEATIIAVKKKSAATIAKQEDENNARRLKLEQELADAQTDIDKLKIQLLIDGLDGYKEDVVRNETGITETELNEQKKRLLAAKKAADAKIKTFKDVAFVEKETAEDLRKKEEKRLKDIEQGFINERRLIDDMAERKKNEVITDIEGEEERAERIAFIEREALNKKLQNLYDETAAETASADAIGTIDEKKYAKQIAEIKKLEAEKASIDRAAKAEAFTRDVEALGLQEELANQAAELSIDNTEELESTKHGIALKYAKLRLEIMTAFAKKDGIITDKEKKDLQEVELIINGLLSKFDNPEVPTLGEMLGFTEEEIGKAMEATQLVATALQGILQITQQISDSKLQNIDREAEAEKVAVEKSTLSEEKKKAKIAAIDKKAAKEKYKIELAQFKTAKALQIALAVANTATAIMAQMSNPTPYVGVVLAALAAATGAVQIGIVASQKPPPPPAFASGGYVRGAGSGTSDSINAKLSNGESVNTAKTTAMFAPMLSAMNAAGGGVDWYNGGGYAKGGLVQKFAAGGVAQSSSLIMRENEAQAELQRTILQTPPVLVLEDFQNVQGRQVRTEQNLAL